MTRTLRRLVAGLTVVLVLGASVWTGTSAILSLMLLFGFGATGVSIYAIRVYHPGRKLARTFHWREPWGFLTLATLCAMPAIYPMLRVPYEHAAIGWTDTLTYMAVSVINIVGLIVILRDRYGHEHLRERLSESFLLAFAITFASWIFYELLALHAPAVAASGATPYSLSDALKLLSMALPDIFGAAVAVQILMSFPVQPPSYRIVVGGALARVFGSLGFLLLFHFGGFALGMAHVATVVFMGSYALAALHPSMARHGDGVQMSLDHSNSWRYVFVAIAFMLGPALTGVLLALHRELRGGSIVVGTTVLPLFITIHVLSLIKSGSANEHEARHDSLTGLPNRVLMTTRTHAALTSTRRTGEAVGILYLDLDRFKTVNDSLGHAAGDQLLQQVALRLVGCVSSADTVSRLSGDEFAILLTRISGVREATDIATQILAAFRTPVDLSRRQQVFITPSIGVAVAADEAIDAETLIAHADTALYQAKDSGRNRFELYEQEMNARAQKRLTLESALRGAVERREFVLYYQPKVDLVSGNIRGVEALVRWNHPEYGLLGPNEFITIAEDSGLIASLGEWVIEEACHQAKKWLDMGFPNLSVAVNLSPKQFQLTSISDIVAHTLRISRLPAELLELEITESLAFYGEDRAIATLEELKAIGVTCAIDDFGTGYSSLSYLARFPIDRLKIDKSFVQQISEGKGEAPLVTAIIAMAHGLGLEVVAEGVERRDQVAFLQRHGCDQIQGHLFSRAIPADELETLIMLEHVSPGQGRLSLPRNQANADSRFGVRDEDYGDYNDALPEPPIGVSNTPISPSIHNEATPTVIASISSNSGPIEINSLASEVIEKSAPDPDSVESLRPRDDNDRPNDSGRRKRGKYGN